MGIEAGEIRPGRSSRWSRSGLSGVGDLGYALGLVRERLWSASDAMILRRDLQVPHEGPKAKIPLTFRPVTSDDVYAILDESPGLDPESRFLLARRRRIAESGIGTCWVGFDDADAPAYLQWIIGPDDNEAFGEHFHHQWNPLAPDEMFLEGSYTLETHRGKAVQAEGLDRVMVLGHTSATRYVLTSIGCDNFPTLKGAWRAGMFPYQIRTQLWRLGRQSVSFVDAGDDIAWPPEAPAGKVKLS